MIDDNYAVEKDVPIPKSTRKSFPLSGLQPGESFAFSSEDRPSIQTMTSALKKRQGKVFVVKKISTNEYRVWRKV